MSILRTYNLQNPDSATTNIELTADGGAVVSGVTTTTQLNVGAGGTIIKTNSEGRVAIGTDIFPSEWTSTLVINGPIESLRDGPGLNPESEGGQVILRAPTQQSGTKYRYIIDNYWGNSAYGLIGANSSGFRVVREDDSDAANGNVLLSVAETGILRVPYQPAFDAVCDPGGGQEVYTTQFTEIIFNEANNNRGNHFSTSTGRFTAPITGTYYFSIGAMNDGNTVGSTWIELRVNGALLTNPHNPYSSVNAAGYRWVSSDYVLQLNDGDYVSVFTGQTNDGVYGGGNNHNHFVGYLIG